MKSLTEAEMSSTASSRSREWWRDEGRLCGEEVEEKATASSSCPGRERGGCCRLRSLDYEFSFSLTRFENTHTLTNTPQKIKPRQPTSADRLTSERNGEGRGGGGGGGVCECKKLFFFFFYFFLGGSEMMTTNFTTGGCCRNVHQCR